jgi:flagellum-specific ATP synthase
VEVGAYRQGADPRVDHAIAAQPRLVDFLRQGLGESSTRDEALQRLRTAVGAQPAARGEAR